MTQIVSIQVLSFRCRTLIHFVKSDAYLFSSTIYKITYVRTFVIYTAQLVLSF